LKRNNGKSRLAIYIHFPFCLSKCPYCDFNSQPIGQIDHAEWAKAYARELAHYATLLPDRRITSVYFGGGTPSLMPSTTVSSVLETINNHWRLESNAEITLEANPTSSEAEKFKSFRAAGVNRLSLGVQSLRDDALKFLGRAHNAAEARQAVECAAKTFPRFSFDLIYARAGQSPADWQTELAEALEYRPKHLSLYLLTIEPGTPFELRNRTTSLTPPENVAAEMFEMTQEILESTGLQAYEISNHARPGEESRHNLAYWHYDDYIGIGPGAHGRYVLDNKNCCSVSPKLKNNSSRKAQKSPPPLEGGDRGGVCKEKVNEQRQCRLIKTIRHATENHRSPNDWLRQVTEQSHGQTANEILSLETAQTEALMMGLRLTKGIGAAAWQKKFGIPLKKFLPGSKRRRLERQNLLIFDENNLRATKPGLERLDAILRELVAQVE